MGQSPNSGGVSLRTFNRNFEGRSGTADAKVYLVCPETAAAAAITGEFTDPRELGMEMPECTHASSLPGERQRPAASRSGGQGTDEVEVLRGPNIKSIPEGKPLTEKHRGAASL